MTRKRVIVWFPEGTKLPRQRWCSVNKQAAENYMKQTDYVPDQLTDRDSTGEWGLIYEDDPLNPEATTEWGKYSL